VPLLYPFVVNDPGEGTQAKRRSHAVVIDHLPPPMTRADSYDDLARLEQLLDTHAQVEAMDPAKLPAIREQVWKLVVDMEIHRDLDEASLTLGASNLGTLRRVVLPLLRPAVIAALVFSFVRAMTAISAVIFLVSAEYDMATSYIIGRVENGDFGLAIAYASVLILVMLVAIVLIQLLVGERRLGRRGASGAILASRGAAA